MTTVYAANFKKLRVSIAISVLLLLLGTAAVMLSNQQSKQAGVAVQQAQRAKQEASSKLARAQDEAVELRQKIAEYQSLKARGLIGQEHRLDWTEQIRRIKHDRRLIDVQYELGPQHLADNIGASAEGAGFEIMASSMKLQMQLLHEGDLLNFLDDLKTSVSAYIRLRRCKVDRIAAGSAERGPIPQLKAECELDWITLREKA